MDYHRTGLFCRNLSLMLSSGVMLPSALRILVDTMEYDRSALRSGRISSTRCVTAAKLSDALIDHAALSRRWRFERCGSGEDSGQLAMLAGRIADFYEAKLQRSLDRAIGVVGPLAIIVISLIVGGLIVSVMTALLSVYQVVD